MDLVRLTRNYFASLSQGVIGEDLRVFYADNALQQEFPNRLLANGASRDLDGILDAAERGQKVMDNQTYDILHIVANGNSVAVEFLWSATAKVEIGSLPVGGVMRGRFASFIDFEDGKIISQRSYDCFEPW